MGHGLVGLKRTERGAMTTATLTVEDIAKRFAAVSNGEAEDPNFAALFAPQVIVWHNFDEEPTTFEGPVLASLLQQEVKVMSKTLADYRNENVRLHIADDAFILVRTTRGTAPDGTDVRLTQCLINFVDGDVIVRSEAHLDRQQAAPLYAVMGQAMEAGEISPPPT